MAVSTSSAREAQISRCGYAAALLHGFGVLIDYSDRVNISVARAATRS